MICSHKVHDIHGDHEMLEHEANVGKSVEISQCDSAKNGEAFKGTGECLLKVHLNQ